MYSFSFCLRWTGWGLGSRAWSWGSQCRTQGGKPETASSSVVRSPPFPQEPPACREDPGFAWLSWPAGPQTLSTALVSTRGFARSYPCSAYCPLCCPLGWPQPQQPCTPCSTQMRRLHGLGPLTWEDRKVMKVTSPPVLPQILHTYAGPWLMHRLHSDRQAWPLSSPWYGLPVAPGAFSWNPRLCTVPAGFSVR